MSRTVRCRRRDAGYTLVALMIWITILGIMLAAVVPVWSHVVQRDREAELIHRGGQYVEAIRVFQRRTGRLPLKLEELYKVQPRSIRRLFKDPITASDDWGLCFQGGICQDSMGVGAQKAPTGPLDPSGHGDEKGDQDKGDTPPIGSPGSQRPPGSDFNPVGSGQTVSTGPIIGVYSKSGDRAIRVYKGRQRYNEWKFTILDLQQGQQQQQQQQNPPPPPPPP